MNDFNECQFECSQVRDSADNGCKVPGPGVRSHNALFTGCLCPGHKAAWLKTRRGDIFSEEIVKVRQLMRAAWVPGLAGWDLLLVYLLEV